MPDAEAEITGEISLDYITVCKAEALKELNKRADIAGFRPGHIPEDVLVKKVGEMGILEEAAEIAIGREYPRIINEAKLSPIGRPHVSITKLAPGVPLEWKIRITLEPEFALPDYKKIAGETSKESEEAPPSEKELKDVLEEIKKREIKVELKEGETLEEKVKKNLLEEKKFRAGEKRRQSIITNLVKDAEIGVPRLLVDAELEKMFAQFKDDIERMGAKFDDYIKEVKKTEKDLKEEWRPRAVERVKAELIIGKIAEAENIEPTAEEVEAEVKHLISHYPDAEPIRAKVYVYSLLRNRKVLEFLENL